MTNVMSLIVRSLDSMISNFEKVLRDFTLEMETKNKQTNKQNKQTKKQTKKHFPGQPQCECSFEFSEWGVTYTSFRAKLIIIYRPPYSQEHPVTPCVFFEEFSSYLKSVILSPEPLILSGDFNFHMDVASDVDARVFSDLLTSMGLKQHVTVPTHISGHTLDLLITREHDPVICSAPVADRYLSDQASVLCTLYSPKPGHVVKEISFSPNVQGDDASAVKAMCDCIMDLRKWMIIDRLMLNDDKT